MSAYKETETPKLSPAAASFAYNFDCVAYSTRDVRKRGGGEGGGDGGGDGGGGGLGGGLGGGGLGGCGRLGSSGDRGWKSVSILDATVATRARSSATSALRRATSFSPR